MRRFALVLAAASLAVPATLPTAAQAKRHRYYGHSRYTNCRASNGAVGTIGGGAGGAVIAGALGASPVGIVASGVGGALLGRHIDKHRTAARNRRRGC